MTLRRGRWFAAATTLGVALFVTPPARADDGPWSALGNMLNASPTLTIVTSSVMILTDGGLTALGLRDALRGTSADRGFYAMQTIVAAPQAIGFALAPFYFDVGRWTPAENLLLVLPFQAWSAALTTHGVWSMARPDFDPASRFGASFLIGVSWAFSSTAIGGAFHDRWVPVEVGVTELVASSLELGLAIDRAVEDPDHAPEWSLLAGWSGLLATHGALSIALYDEDGSSNGADRSLDRAAPPPLPFVTPSPTGLTVGVSGAF